MFTQQIRIINKNNEYIGFGKKLTRRQIYSKSTLVLQIMSKTLHRNYFLLRQ